jgi:hypothetical protein
LRESGEPDLCIRGMGWVAERMGDRITASVPTGKWFEGELIYDISAADFERLRSEPEAFCEIHRSYNEVRGDGWTAQRDRICVIYLRPSHFPDNRRFEIPNEAFERLRDEPARFVEIYSAFRTNHV